MKLQRGVTLIELMFTLALGSIIAYMFFESLQAQRRVMLQSLDHTEGMQNGRAALSMLKRYVRNAGWGFQLHTDVDGVLPHGVVPIGTCADLSTPKNASVTGCDCGPVPATCLNDRLRIVFIEPDTFTETQADADLSVDTIQVTDTAVPLAVGDLAAISGVCNSLPFTELLTIDGVSINGTTKIATYNVTRFDIGAEACTGFHYLVGASFGKAALIDVYIDKTNTQHPELRLKQWQGDGSFTEDTVAFDIEDMQVRYAIDTTLPNPDGLIANTDWCDDISDNSTSIALGGCEVTGLDDNDKLGRLVAAQIALVVRSRNFKQELVYQTLPPIIPLSPWNTTIRTHGDGYFHWIFRTTVALRNKDL